MKCPKCGNETDEGDRYCRRCGRKIRLKKPDKNFVQTTADVESDGNAGAAEKQANAAVPVMTFKERIYKNSLRIIFAVFVIFAFIFFTLPVSAMTPVSVYGCAAAGGYGEGLSGHLDEFYFVAQLIENLFSNVDLVMTPCALMFIAAVCGGGFAVVYIILLFCAPKLKNSGNASRAADVLFLVFYALFAVMDAVLIYGVKHRYGERVGAAPVALMVLTIAAFALSLTFYILLKKYKQPPRA